MPTDFSVLLPTDVHTQRELWIGALGAMFVLFQSILSGERRVWWRLLISCVIGGAAAAVAGSIFADSKFVYAICGVSAIVAENVLFGLAKASVQFRNDPVKFIAIAVPNVGSKVIIAKDS